VAGRGVSAAFLNLYGKLHIPDSKRGKKPTPCENVGEKKKTKKIKVKVRAFGRSEASIPAVGHKSMVIG